MQISCCLFFYHSFTCTLSRLLPILLLPVLGRQQLLVQDAKKHCSHMPGTALTFKEAQSYQTCSPVPLYDQALCLTLDNNDGGGGGLLISTSPLSATNLLTLSHHRRTLADRNQQPCTAATKLKLSSMK